MNCNSTFSYTLTNCLVFNKWDCELPEGMRFLFYFFFCSHHCTPRIVLHIKWSLNKYLLPRQMNEWALLNTLGEEQKPPGSPTSQRLWARHPARTLPLLRCLRGSSGQPRSGSRGDQRGRWLNLLLQEWKWKWKIGSRKDYIFR